MKKGIKGTLFVLLYLALSFITQFFVSTVATVIGTVKMLPGLNLAEQSDVDALTESVQLWMTEHSILLTLIADILLLGILFLILYVRRIPLRHYLGNGKFTLRNAFASLLLLSGAGVAVALLLNLPFIIPHLDEHQELMSSITSGNPVLVFITVGLLAPIVEEFTFRAMIYGEMKTFMPPWLGILLSALLFGVWHGNLVQSTYTFLLGVLLAATYEKTDSFAVPVLMHILFNTLNFVPDLLGDVDTMRILLAGTIWFVWGWKLLRKKTA